MIPTPTDPVAPMLAKAVTAVPDPDSVDGGLSFEPKWDGFRAIVYFDGDTVEIGSRGSKMLTRYFPELTDAFARLLPGGCVLDGEIVVPTGEPGNQKLDWEALSQRIHPAESRVRKLSVETPAIFVAFDLISVGDRSLLDAPFSERRAELERFLDSVTDPIKLSQVTRDVELARQWLVEFEGAGLDGVVAKPLAQGYAPNKRVMLKVKHQRTADAVVLGYRDPQERPGCRVAAARAVRRRRHAAQRRRHQRIQRQGAAATGGRTRPARHPRRRRQPGARRDRPQPVLLQPGRVLRAARARPSSSR